MLEKIQKKDWEGLEELLKHKVVEVDMPINELAMSCLHVVCSILSDKA